MVAETASPYQLQSVPLSTGNSQAMPSKANNQQAPTHASQPQTISSISHCYSQPLTTPNPNQHQPAPTSISHPKQRQINQAGPASPSQAQQTAAMPKQCQSCHDQPQSAPASPSQSQSAPISFNKHWQISTIPSQPRPAPASPDKHEPFQNNMHPVSTNLNQSQPTPPVQKLDRAFDGRQARVCQSMHGRSCRTSTESKKECLLEFGP